MRMTDLADSMSNTKSGLTYQVNQLESAGLVCRRACGSDPRGVVAVITPGQLAAIADGLGEISRRLGARLD